MKHFFLFFSFLCSLVVTGQVNVTVKPADTIVCFRDSVAFTTLVTGSGTATIFYRWQKNYIDISGPGATDSIYTIAHVLSSSPGIFRCIISVEGLGVDTSNDVILRMHPKMNFDTFYRYNPLGCATIDTTSRPLCIGQFKTLISGGTPSKIYPPYIYSWGGGFSQDTIVFGLCPGNHTFTITDSIGCSIDSVYNVDVLKSPKVDFDFIPKDTIYMTNPNIQVVFPDSMKKYLTNWNWDFGDKIKIPNLNPVSHTYGDTTKPGLIYIRLSFTDLNGCDTIIIHELTVRLAELKITNLLTPNGDGANDTFKIQLKDGPTDDFRQAYLSNELIAYDRWGKKVYNRKDYKSEDWDGANLSDGTYFYILKCKGQYGDDVFKGSVTILREK